MSKHINTIKGTELNEINYASCFYCLGNFYRPLF
jgi:hypothetical protein